MKIDINGNGGEFTIGGMMKNKLILIIYINLIY